MKDRRKQFKFELEDYIKNLQQLCLVLDDLWQLIRIRHEQEQTDPSNAFSKLMKEMESIPSNQKFLTLN